MKGLNLHILLTRLPISVTGNHAFGALTIMLITHIFFYHAAQGYASGFLQDVPEVRETVWRDTPCKRDIRTIKCLHTEEPPGMPG